MISLDYYSNTLVIEGFFFFFYLVTYPKFLNGKLEDGANYGVFQRSFDKDGAYESEGFVKFTTNKDHTVTIVVVVVVLIVVVAAVGAGIFFYRRRQNSASNGDEEVALRPQKRLRTLTNKLRGRGSGAFGKFSYTLSVLLLLLLLFTQFVALLFVRRLL